MARDYALVHDSMFFQLHEMQPPAHFAHPHYQLHPLTPNTSAASPYEVTTSEGGVSAGAGGSGGPTPAPAPLHLAPSPSCLLDLDHRKRKSQHFGSSCSAYDDDYNEDSRSSRSSLPDKKQNHSEIEKRRRDKMNTYITELSSMIPMCGAMSRKLDKLTVLRMAVQHMRRVRGALAACPLAARPRPACLSERDLNQLVLRAAHDAFLLVVGCDRGRLLYVSASVRHVLHYDQSELVGQSLFDLLHPKDVAKVKEQLSSDLSPRERLIDAKTMLPVKTDIVTVASRLCPGARRSFFCRIKRDPAVKQEPAAAATAPKTRKKLHDKKYCVVQCTGYLKSWAPADMSEGGATEMDGDGEGAVSCLVAVGRALPSPSPPPPAAARPLHFTSRHATDGKFLFVDQRVTLALGFLPQELVGTSLYELVGAGEAALGAVARAHKHALLRRVPRATPPYALRRKDGGEARVVTHFKPFRNPWTKDVECLVADHALLAGTDEAAARHDTHDFDLFKHEPDLEMQQLIDSQVESHKIGSAIAEEVLRQASPVFSPELPADLLHDVFNQQFSNDGGGASQTSTGVVDSILCGESELSPVRNNVPLSAAGAGSPPPAQGGAGGGGGAEPTAGTSADEQPAPSPLLPPLALDGNGEATMAVIMSLLEADAGLGGPVNFSGLPWPLP